MNLPDTLVLLNFSINTFGLFLLLGFFLATFVVWQEANRDGFDEEKIIDLLIVSTLSGVIFSRLVFALSSGASVLEAIQHTYKVWSPGMDIYGGFVGLLTPIYFLSRYWKWSVYRIYDIFALAWSLGLAIVMLGYVGIQQRFEYLFAFSAWLLVYVALFKVRNLKIRSGAVFSVFLTINVILGIWYAPHSRYLILYALLVTISAATLYFRELRSATKTTMLTPEFLNKIKSKLLKKDADLKKAEVLLKKEDPYNQTERVDDNADLQDDAAEDIEHNSVQIQLSAIQKTRAQIKLALTRLKAGTYGKDTKTGETIPKERLEVYPEATTTVNNSDEN